MITEIYAQNFKGQTFKRGIDQKVILIGPNGSGKSTHTDALKLAINGYIPGRPKKIDQIFNIYNGGSADEMAVGFVLNGKDFMRVFIRIGDKTTQDFYIDGHKVTSQKFISTLGENGHPKIFDLSNFFNMSNNKKIDFIFELFPPAGDLSDIDQKMLETNDEISRIRKKVEQAESTAERLEKALQAKELPNGSLEETEQEIIRTKEEISMVKKSIRQKEDEELAKKAQEFKASETPGKPVFDDIPFPTAPPPTDRFDNVVPINKPEAKAEPQSRQVTQWPSPKATPDQKELIIQKLEQIAKDVGCVGICTLLMVAKREIRRL